jgi:hypothetical protein
VNLYADFSFKKIAVTYQAFADLALVHPGLAVLHAGLEVLVGAGGGVVTARAALKVNVRVTALALLLVTRRHALLPHRRIQFNMDNLR